MSWFQTGLSSLTGQIGNFTREVLTEGTEEIEDVATELKVARSKLTETELLCSTQRKELEQLKRFNDELRVQMESKELQIQSVTDNFREILAAKESELLTIKKGQLELEGASHSARTDSFSEGADDTEDVLLLQHKISNLQTKIVTLETELDKLRQKELAHSSDGSSPHDSSEEKIPFLEKKIKSLEKELSDRLDRHQQEFVSLQDSHRQNLISVKRNHGNVVEQFKEKIQRLEKELLEKEQSSAPAPAVAVDNTTPRDTNGNSLTPEDDVARRALLEKLDHLERKNAKLEFDSAQVHAVDRKKTELIEMLQRESDVRKEDVKVLSEKLQKEILSREDLFKEFQLLLEENQTLMGQLNAMKLSHKSEKDELQKKMKEMEERLSTLTSERSDGQTAGENLDDFESRIIQLKRELMDAENARISESEVSAEKLRGLEGKLADVEEELRRSAEDSKKVMEDLEVKKSDLEAEKMLLKRRVSELEEQVKTLAENLAECQKLKENTEAVLAMERRDREFGAVIDRDLLKQKNLELERELEKVASEFTLLERSAAALESDLSSAKEELGKQEIENRENLEEVRLGFEAEIRTLRDEVSSLKQLLNASKQTEGDENHLEEIKNENDNLKLKLLALEAELELQKYSADVDRSRMSGAESNSEMENLRKEVEILSEKLEQSESVSTLYEAEVERLSLLEKHYEELKRNYDRLQSDSRDAACNGSPTVKRCTTGSSLGSETSASSEVDPKVEISTLRLTVSKQEELIKTLNGKYSSVFKLLEDRSVELFGSEKMLVRLDQLQTELESIQKEREHMMSILDDKTREASTLKVEVHRLMDAVSAGKAALDRLQKERTSSVIPAGGLTVGASSSALNSGQGSSGETEEENGDMKREAVKKLSQMIKDRDFEIDALNKKNETLLQVLQTESNESMNHEVKRLLSERDSLQKHVSSFQMERDQLVNTLAAKQSENLGYVDELDRQKKIADDLSAELERLRLSHRSLAQQLDEKQTSLIKLLDEHSTTRQKLARLEREKDDDESVPDDDGDKNGERPEGTRCSFTVGMTEEEGCDGGLGEPTKTGKEGEAENQGGLESGEAAKNRTKRAKRSSRTTRDEDDSERSRGNRMVSGMVERLMREKEYVILDREKTIAELKSKVLYFESEVVRLQSALASSENLVRQKDSEVSSSKKHIESLTFKLQGEINRRSEVETDLEDTRTKMKEINSELSAARNSNASFVSSLAQKDQELDSLRRELERSESVSSPDVESPDDNPSVAPSAADTRRSLIETNGGCRAPTEKAESLLEIVEGLQRKEEEYVKLVINYHQEREQLYMAVQFHQNEALEAKNNLSNIQDSERRLAKECDRLRNHLVSIEEGYTREALEAEEREKDLRNQLAAAQEKIASLTDSVLANRSDLSKQTDSLQLQLHSISEQRDNALIQLSSAQETISSYSSSLSNLQMVLEQFQSERMNQQSLEVEKFQVAFNKKQIECQQLQSQVQLLLVEMEDHTEAIRAAQRLSEQMDKKEHLISALKEEVRLREVELKKTEDEIKKLTSSTEAKVDKLLMKSLLIGYFHAPASKRLEAFNVIGHILNFSSDELNNIGMSGSGSSGWMEGIFGKKPSSSLSKSRQSSLNQSFSELFVSFLERESTPKYSDTANLRLPAERMIAEQQKKLQDTVSRPRNSPAFNPFSVPISTNPVLPSSQAPALGAQGSAGSALFEQSSNLLSSQIPPTSAYYPSIVPPSVQGSKERPPSRRDSFVPIVLAAAAASPSIIPVYGNINANNSNNVGGKNIPNARASHGKLKNK